MKTLIGLVLSSVLLSAQGNSQSALVRNLNNKILEHRALIQAAGAHAVDSLRDDAATDIEQRELALAALIESDPQEAIKLAFSADLIQQLQREFPGSANRLEQQGVWRGVHEVMVIDDPHHKASMTIHRLKTNSGFLKLYFSGPEPDLRSGAVVSVTGVRAKGNVVAAQDGVGYDLTGGPAGMPASTTGAQNVATILVNLPDFTLAPTANQDLMNGILYGNAYSSSQSTPDWSVDDFWQQNSDGLTFAPYAGGRIVGPYQLTSDFNTDSNGAGYCDYQSMLQAALDAADPDVNFQNFNRIVIVFPYNGACAWAGLGSVGSWTNSSPLAGSFTASVAWLRSDQLTSRALGVQLAAHELGHGLGLHHSSTRDFSTPGPRVAAGPLATQGTWDEYGDLFSVMGYWSFGFYPSSQAEEILGWLAANYQTVTTSGQYGVQAYETRNASGMVKALKIQRDTSTNSWLWLEYRTNTGNYDSQLNSQVWSGALIHYEDAFTNVHSNLLDFTPASTTFTDPALAVGQTWIDSYTNVSITVNSIVGGTLNVTITYGPPPCVHANPAVVLSPPNPSVNGASSTTYALAVTNNDTAACAPSTFSLTSAQPSGFTGTLSPASLAIAPGASGTSTLTEKASNTIGTYPVSVAATSTSNSSYTTTGTANITVTNSCIAANPTVTLSPASSSVLPGGSQAFTATVKNNNSPVCSQTAFTITAAQPSGLTGKLSFTSLSLKSGASSTTTLTETASSTLGTFSIPVTATNSSATSYSGTAAAALNVMPCTLANPTVTLSPMSGSAAPSGSVAFTVTVQNNNASVCSSAAFALSAAQPSGLTGKLSSTSVTLASGANSKVTLTETASSTANGTYSVPITATNSSSSSYLATATATVNVVPCTLANPTVSLSPASASINFSTAATFTVSVLNNNSSTCASSAFTLAAATITGLTAKLSVTSITLASGASGTATLTETAGTTAGTFSPSVKASFSTYTATGTATLSVVATTVVVTTDSSSYIPLSAVTMTATVGGATPIPNASVTFTLKRPSGTTTTHTGTTNASGVATWTYTLASSDPNGTYTPSAVATVSNVKYTSPAATFVVSP